jgi:UDP-N-acetyl-D-glucosamine dehydrogenase
MDIAIIGQGYVGLPILMKAAEAGFNVIGFDIDSDRIHDLKSGKTSTPDVSQADIMSFQSSGKLKFTTEILETAKCDIFIIAVPTPLSANREPDLSPLKSACELIGSVIKNNALVINESTSFIGTLRNLIKPIIDKESNFKKVNYAVAPERIDPGNSDWGVKNTPRVVSGLDSYSTNSARDFYSSFCNDVLVVSKPEVAEAVKLFENTFRYVNMGLVNNFSKLAHKFDFTAHEVISAAASKPFGFMPFYPSAGVGGHCIPIDPNYLEYSAKELGFELDFIKIADQINIKVPEYIIQRIKLEIFRNLNGINVQIAGIAYKPNISDIRESPALTLLKLLRLEGANVTWHDPLVEIYQNEKSSALTTSIDLGLIVTPHKVIDFSPWKNADIRVLDLSGSKDNFGWPKFL